MNYTGIHRHKTQAAPASGMRAAEVAYILKRQKAGERRRVKKPAIKLAPINVPCP